MRIAIVTDAWFPQVNGVVRTLSRVKRELQTMDHAVTVISPDLFTNLPCPTYPEIRLAVLPGRGVRLRLDEAAPDAIHIATEGPLGWAARGYCRRRGQPFTTSFHTRFPEYVHARSGIPPGWLYRLLRRFHGAGEGIMVATRTIRRDLETRGFDNIRDWTRGVDTELFRPRELISETTSLTSLPRPIHLYVGRVAVEKNIGAFLALDLPGSKVVVGDGPQRKQLAGEHPNVVFTGAKHGEELARHYADADVFVFPSRTDTFGLVLLEAMAAGVPVAAYPVPGPLDVVDGSGAGVLHDDLKTAATEALAIPRETCRDHAMTYSWQRCAQQFLDNLAPFR
ncbi:MAG: glycosyltransferase family 1 protein [Pseudomonadota bacterium]